MVLHVLSPAENKSLVLGQLGDAIAEAEEVLLRVSRRRADADDDTASRLARLNYLLHDARRGLRTVRVDESDDVATTISVTTPPVETGSVSFSTS